MRNWSRLSPFEPSDNQIQIWVYTEDDENKEEYRVRVSLGKPIEIVELKLNMVEDFEKNVKKIRETAIEFYSNKSNLEIMAECPICGSEDSVTSMEIYGAQYNQCKECTHYYIKKMPKKEALDKYYATDDFYQFTYADKRNSEIRVKQVAQPKAEWSVDVFERVYGRKPNAILDVGAGSGHFVYACRQIGIKADGLELSSSGRTFSKTVFDIELINKDFSDGWEKWKNYEMITFWGVIEHIRNPMKMVSTASEILRRNGGLIVTAVPRWNCVATSVQKIFHNTVVRHLQPLGHINCFTDSSLATTFRSQGFGVVAAWYFGMDAYDMITQMGCCLGDNKVVQKMKESIPVLQKRFERGMLSDEMVFAGKPIKGES